MGIFMEYFWYLIAAAVIIAPWLVLTKTIEALPNRQSKARQKAIEMGHVLTATLVKQYYNTGGTDKDQTRQTYCVYRYEYKGKSYKYEIYNDYPPQTITLYYLKDPKKAGGLGDIVIKKRRWWLRIAIMTGIIIIIAKILV